MDKRTVIIGNGTTIILAARAADTGGLFALLDYELAPGYAGLPPHSHAVEDAAIYVLEGWLRVRLVEQGHLVGAGEFVFLPRGVVHAYSNPTREPVRFMLLLIPAGFEQCFRDLDTAIERDAAVTPERITLLLARYGTEIVG